MQWCVVTTAGEWPCAWCAPRRRPRTDSIGAKRNSAASILIQGLRQQRAAEPANWFLFILSDWINLIFCRCWLDIHCALFKAAKWLPRPSMLSVFVYLNKVNQIKNGRISSKVLYLKKKVTNISKIAGPCACLALWLLQLQVFVQQCIFKPQEQCIWVPHRHGLSSVVLCVALAI